MAVHTVTLEPKKHIYTRDDGVVIPSVTQVLEAAGLYPDWSKVAPDVMERAKALGTAVHLATYYCDDNDLDVGRLDEELIPYVEAWVAFREDSGFDVRQAEVVAYNEIYQYAGTIDRVGMFNGAMSIVEIKTGVFAAVVGPQTAAHSLLLGEGYERFAVLLRPDGTYRLTGLTDPNDVGVFLSALNLWYWKKRNLPNGNS